jgi:hypothetical protein
MQNNPVLMAAAAPPSNDPSTIALSTLSQDGEFTTQAALLQSLVFCNFFLSCNISHKILQDVIYLVLA